MKVIELLTLLNDLDPEYRLTFEQEKNTDRPKITFSSEHHRLNSYIYWLNNRYEELGIVPQIGDTLQVHSKQKTHKYWQAKYFELRVIGRTIQYKEGYSDYPGRWEVVIQLTYPSQFESIAAWHKYMDHNDY